MLCPIDRLAAMGEQYFAFARKCSSKKHTNHCREILWQWFFYLSSSYIQYRVHKDFALRPDRLAEIGRAHV